MTYLSGFVTPVATSNREVYRDFAHKAWPFFRKHGALRMVEAWGDNVPEGKQTDFRRAVQAKPEETVVFSWIEWPDRATADAAQKAMMEDPAMAEIGDMPFDGKRMIYGGFEPLVDTDRQTA